MERLDKKILRNQRQVARGCGRALDLGPLAESISAGARSFFKRIRWGLARLRHRHSTRLWLHFDRLLSLLDQRGTVLGKLLQDLQTSRLQTGATEHREQLRLLRTAITERTGTKQDRIFDNADLPTILRTLPIWLTNLSDVHRTLPHQRELFDVAVIDEASQCDLASSLPLLQRARRAVIVGDPKQLRHLSFVSRSRQEELARRYGLGKGEAAELNYRDRSLLDLAIERIDSAGAIHLLNEHFRSQPEIIHFSNSRFYSGKLNIMSDRPGPRSDSSVPPPQGLGHPGCERGQ